MGHNCKRCTKNENLKMDTKLLAKKLDLKSFACLIDQEPHLASSLSCADIISVLYEKILKTSKKNKKFSDKFILASTLLQVYILFFHIKNYQKKRFINLC